MSYQRIVITQFGSPEVLQVVEQPTLPEPQTGEVRIRVLATSASFTDVMIRKGKYPGLQVKPPFSPGYDLVGVVDKQGPNATRFTVGQHVGDLTVTGGYTEYLCRAENGLTPLPEELEPAAAVSLILSYLTAYQLLHRVANVQPSQRIVVKGAGGAVGSAMLQLGQLQNLSMIGIDAASKQRLIADSGAIPVDYQCESWENTLRDIVGDGVDAVFDPIGGASLPRSLSWLRAGGILAAYGFHTAVLGQGGSIPLDFLRLKLWNWLPNGRATQFYSITALRQRHPEWFTADLARLFELLAQGKIKPAIAAQLPLTKARQAHEMIERGDVLGKLVLLATDPAGKARSET